MRGFHVLTVLSLLAGLLAASPRPPVAEAAPAAPAASPALAAPPAAPPLQAAPDPRENGPFAVRVGSYTGTQSSETSQVFPAAGSATRDVDLSAQVYMPVGPGPFPLVIFLHGQHAACVQEEDSTEAAPRQGICPNGWVVVPSHKGYAYLAQPLASWGYIVVSIDAHQMNWTSNVSRTSLGINDPAFNYFVSQEDAFKDDTGLLLARGRLVLTHLELWRHWAEGTSLAGLESFTPMDFSPADVRNNVDFSRVGLMGHSRGGEGVRAAQAYLEERLPDAGLSFVWPFETRPQVKAIFEIAPTDDRMASKANIDPVNLGGAPWNVLLPMCDGDVLTLSGIRPFDRFMRSREETVPSQKSAYLVWGANHGAYNTVWTKPEDADDGDCDGRQGNVDLLPAAQRETGLVSLLAFFRGNLPGAAAGSYDPTFNRLFNPLAPLPSYATVAASQPVTIERSLSTAPEHNLVLEDFETDPVPNTWSGQGISYSAGPLQATDVAEHDPAQHAAQISWSWTMSGPPPYAQLNWAPRNLGDYSTLDMRIARRDHPSNQPGGSTNFALCLLYTDADGSRCSRPVSIARYLTLRGPVGRSNKGADLHPLLATARIPLEDFDVADLTRVQGLRLMFYITPAGSIDLANVEASREEGVGMDDVSEASSCSPTAPAPADGDSLALSALSALSWGVCAGHSYLLYLSETRDDLLDPDALAPLALAQPSSSLASLPALRPGATYFWRVVSHDGGASVGESPIWQFSLSDALVRLPSSRGAGFDGCQDTVLPANDDGSTQAAIPLGFQINFFNRQYDRAFVNNNGNITFDRALGTFTPFGLQSASIPIIAPFFGDVDTRGSGSAPVSYSYGATTYAGRRAFCVNWLNVGYYASHADKLNSFQLVLVERADTGAGNFDIMMNYGKVQWETGDASGGRGGLGGSSARMGYSNGSSASFELPGSGVNGAFLDSNLNRGLVHNSLGTTVRGRYLFEVRNGSAPTGGSIAGGVYANAVGAANALSGALVQVCAAGGTCRLTLSNAAGQYQVSALAPDQYTVTAFPPASSSATRRQIGPLTLASGASLTGQNVVLSAPAGPPPGTTITSRAMSAGGLPVVYWGETLTLATQGCPGGTASYRITQGGVTLRVGTLGEGPAGRYSGTIAPLRPALGPARVEIEIACPDGTSQLIAFEIYIDPSGWVRTVAGAPIVGARVTLYRSDSAVGPFELVPNGSALMSPMNRRNPDLTDAEGHFGWDVVAGYYQVRAEAEGCHAPDNPAQAYVESGVMPIPPPVTDLDLRLECAGDSEPPVIACPAPDGLWHAANVQVQCTAEDSGSGLAGADATFVLSTSVAEGVETAAASTDARQVCDRAGNCATAGPLTGYKIDRRAPTLVVEGLSDGASYLIGAAPTPTCGASDAGSGLAAPCSGVISEVSGGVGLFTYTASAVDQAGNQALVSLRYTIVYPFQGFFRPLDNLPALNVVKAGSAVPVKFALGGYQGLQVFAAGYPRVVVIDCNLAAPLNEVEETVTAGSSSLSYDLVEGQYVYVWKTSSAWAGSCRQLVVRLSDTTVQRVNLRFK